MRTPDAQLTIGIDFDDTLWHTTPHFERGRAILEGIFDRVGEGETSAGLVQAIEERRISTYGYGYASFVLAAVEALLSTEGRTQDLAMVEPLFDWAHDTQSAPVELLEGVEETLPKLASEHRLIGITRGSIPTQVDLFLRSGLGDYFGEVEILGRKTVGRYESILRRHRIAANRFVMIGDSLAADIEPALAAGGFAIHIPYAGGWDDAGDRLAEADAGLASSHRWARIGSFSDVPETVQGMVGNGSVG